MGLETLAEKVGQKVLELVSFHAERVGPEGTPEPDAGFDHFVDRKAQKLRVGIQIAVFSEGQHDERREVAPVRVPAFARVEGHDAEGGFGGKFVEPEVFPVEVFLLPLAKVGVDRRVLLFTFKRAFAGLGPHFHQRQKVFLLRPEDHRAKVHFLPVGFVETLGGQSVWGGKVQALPLVPKVHPVRPAEDRTENPRPPPRRAAQLQREGVPVERGRQVDHVRAGIPGFQQRAEKPVPRRVAQSRGAAVRLVLKVVADDQARPVRAVAASAEFLTGSVRFDQDPVGKKKPVFPTSDLPVQGRLVAEFQGRAGRESLPKVFEVQARLVLSVRNDPDVRLHPFQGAAERERERPDGRFGVSARGKNVEPAPPLVREMIQHAEHPAVHQGRGAAEKIRQEREAPRFERSVPRTALVFPMPGLTVRPGENRPEPGQEIFKRLKVGGGKHLHRVRS